MVRKGYFDQQMEQLGLVFARLLKIRTNGGREAEIREALHTEAKTVIGLNLGLLPTLSDATLLSLFKGGNVLDAARCVLAAHLIAEDAGLFQAEGKNGAARAGYRRAVMLLDAAMVQEDVLQTGEYRAKRQEWADKYAAVPSA